MLGVRDGSTSKMKSGRHGFDANLVVGAVWSLSSGSKEGEVGEVSEETTGLPLSARYCRTFSISAPSSRPTGVMRFLTRLSDAAGTAIRACCGACMTEGNT